MVYNLQQHNLPIMNNNYSTSNMSERISPHLLLEDQRDDINSETIQGFPANEEARGSPAPSYIKIRNEDVLCGREAGLASHPGNAHFRSLIKQYQTRYKTADAIQKTEISKSIVHKIEAGQGRFLRREGTTGMWSEIPREAAESKVSQALRDCPDSTPVKGPDIMFQAVESRMSSSPLESPTTTTAASTSGGVDGSDITENDVLFGRGGVTNNHIGNRRYRNLVQLNQGNYFEKPKLLKADIAKQIVARIREENGRFLKKSKETGMWYDVGDKKAREKTSQALRERGPAIKSVIKAAHHLVESKRASPLPYLAKPMNITPTPVVVVASPTREISHQTGAVLVPQSPLLNVSVVSSEIDNKAKRDNKANFISTNEINMHDVCCGRGAGVNNLEGNKSFRHIVALHSKEYHLSAKRDKAALSRDIVEKINSKGGRFLKKTENGKWSIIPTQQAIVKTSQAFREHSAEVKEQVLRQKNLQFA